MEYKKYPSAIFKEKIGIIKDDMNSYFKDAISLYQKSQELIFNYNEEDYHEVLNQCDRLDLFNHEIERKCIRFISMECPLAGDLIYVESTLKVLSHIERITHLSKNIAKVSKNVICSIDLLLDVEEMVNYVGAMLMKVFKSFKNQDVEVAYDLIDDDEKVDELFDSVLKETTEILSHKTDHALAILDILFISRFLERIADRVVNISERIIFINTHKKPSIEKIRKFGMD